MGFVTGGEGGYIRKGRRRRIGRLGGLEGERIIQKIEYRFQRLLTNKQGKFPFFEVKLPICAGGFYKANRRLNVNCRNVANE